MSPGSSETLLKERPAFNLARHAESIPMNRALFHADANFSAAELKRYADEAVRIFLAAYGDPRVTRP